MQGDEPPIEAEKVFSARVTDGKKQSDHSPVTIVEPVAIDPLMEARSALGRREYATAKRLFEACERRDLGAVIEEVRIPRVA